MLPTFLIIGAQKCGTTSLYAHLDRHPEVFMSRLKEPHFFAWRGRDFDLAGPNARDAAWQIVNDLDTYEGLFAEAGPALARGEASSGYLQAPHAAANMLELVPDIKLVAIFRDPIRRARSAFHHARRLGIEPLATLREGLEAEEQRRAEDWTGMVHYASTGCYATALEPYLEAFPPEQLRLYLNDDLARDPDAVLRDLHGYLGVTPMATPEAGERHNQGRVVRRPGLERMLRRSSAVATLRRVVPEKLARRVYATVNERPLRPMDERARAMLVERLAPEIAGLSAIMGRDLGPWLEGRDVPAPDGPVGATPQRLGA